MDLVPLPSLALVAACGSVLDAAYLIALLWIGERAVRKGARLFVVISLVLVAIISATSTGSQTQRATARPGDAASPPVEQVQARLVASSNPYDDDVDVVSAGSSVYTCGVVSCSYYINRQGTRSAAEYIERHENAANVALAGIATGACVATGAGGAAVGVCITAANAAAAYVMDEIKAAGERGQCLRLHYYHYPVLLPATPAADTSGYCQNG